MSDTSPGRPFLASHDTDQPNIPATPSSDFGIPLATPVAVSTPVPPVAASAPVAATPTEVSQGATEALPEESTVDQQTTPTGDPAVSEATPEVAVRSSSMKEVSPFVTSPAAAVGAVAVPEASTIEKLSAAAISPSLAPPMPHYASSSRRAAQSEMIEPIKPASPKKFSTGLVVGVAAVAVVAVGVFSLNQDIYSLNEQGHSVASKTKTETNTPATLAAIAGKRTVSFGSHSLPKLEKGYYQLWLEQDDQTTSIGMFVVSDDGKTVTADGKDFAPVVTFSEGTATLFVTVEAGNSLATKPSATVIVSGEATGAGASLVFTAVDVSKVSGTYVLATPTDPDGEHQTSGIWMAKTDGKTLTGAGLQVPAAPDGWSYEGQVIYKDQVVAMGRFKAATDKDSMTTFTPNKDKAPAWPGEDYLEGAPSRLGIDFPANLASGEWKVVISLEPDQNGTDPSGDGTFPITLLTAEIGSESKAYQEYALKTDNLTLPKATVLIK